MFLVYFSVYFFFICVEGCIRGIYEPEPAVAAFKARCAVNLR